MLDPNDRYAGALDGFQKLLFSIVLGAMGSGGLLVALIWFF